MKKFWILWIVYFGLLIGIAVANNVVLLNLHPLSYYYTAPGWWKSAAISAAEAMIIWPLSWIYLKKILIPTLLKDSKKEES